MAIYYDTNEYIEEFDINTKIVDTEERDKMCELWTELAYSKIYLMSLCYDESNQNYRWYKEQVYWTGWEWNEQNDHIHGIGTMRDLNDIDEQQKNHMVFDKSFGLIISEKRIQEMHKELKTDDLENLRKKYKNLTDDGIDSFGKCLGDLLIDYRNYSDDFMNHLYKLNSGDIPGMLKIKFPKFLH